jgi:hypothetical protein
MFLFGCPRGGNYINNAGWDIVVELNNDAALDVVVQNHLISRGKSTKNMYNIGKHQIDSDKLSSSPYGLTGTVRLSVSTAGCCPGCRESTFQASNELALHGGSQILAAQFYCGCSKSRVAKFIFRPLITGISLFHPRLCLREVRSSQSHYWLSPVHHRSPWITMDHHGSPWITDHHGSPWPPLHGSEN